MSAEKQRVKDQSWAKNRFRVKDHLSLPATSESELLASPGLLVKEECLEAGTTTTATHWKATTALVWGKSQEVERGGGKIMKFKNILGSPLAKVER